MQTELREHIKAEREGRAELEVAGERELVAWERIKEPLAFGLKLYSITLYQAIHYIVVSYIFFSYIYIFYYVMLCYLNTVERRALYHRRAGTAAIPAGCDSISMRRSGGRGNS